MLIEKVLSTIEKYKMLKKNDVIVVGVSGGPDSMCLLHVLLNLRKEYELKIIAAHVNHCLRGTEADMDEEFVRNFCEKNSVEFFSERIDINKLSEAKNISCEEAGRAARYDFFKKVMKDTKASKVALAHNANDSVETILMRFFRGTGLEGLEGIRPIRDGIYIRPLINVKRCDIEEYCSQNGLNPRIDRTNLEEIYSRNKIRLSLLPYIKENFNKNILDTILRNSEILRIDNDFIEKAAAEKYRKFCTIEDKKVIIASEAFREHEAIISRIIRMALEKLKGSTYDIEKTHIYDIIKVQINKTGKTLNLPLGLSVYNDYGNIIITGQNLYDNPEYFIKEYELNEGSNVIKEIGLNIKVEAVSLSNNHTYKGKENAKYFDSNEIKNITLRFRRDGDRYIPFGMEKCKKLKDEFIDLKISKYLRNRIPLICFNNKIAWIVGYKTSNCFRVNDKTNKILKITVEREE